MITVLAGLLSGIMFYLSQGYDSVWALAWLAPIPLLWLAYGNASLRRVMAASAVACCFGLIYLLQAHYPLALLPSLAPTVVLSVALFCTAMWIARFVSRHANPLVVLFTFPACWTAFEFLVELRSANGSYGSWAYTAMSAPVLIQSASLLGMYAVTFLICLFANTVAMALRPRRGTVVAVGLGVVILAANVAFGIVRLERSQSGKVRVAAIVDETALGDSWHAHSLTADLAVTQIYAGEIRLAAQEGARFVVTPEGGMASTPALQSAIVAPLVAAAKEARVQVISGFHSDTPPADFALAIMPDGRIQRYDKRHPVPGLENRFTPGHASGWLGRARAMEICKDMDFPGTIRADAAKGVRLMGVPAGDFGIDRWQHGRMAIMRGVENGFAMVRPANDGLIIVSDAQGRLVAIRKDASRGLTMVVTDVPLGPGPTFYTRIGDLFPWICVFLSLLLGAIAAARSGSWQTASPLLPSEPSTNVP